MEKEKLKDTVLWILMAPILVFIFRISEIITEFFTQSEPLKFIISSIIAIPVLLFLVLKVFLLFKSEDY